MNPSTSQPQPLCAFKQEEDEDGNENVIFKKSSLPSLPSSLSVNVGSRTPERQPNSIQVPSKERTKAALSAQVSPKVYVKPLAKAAKKAILQMFPPNPNRDKTTSKHDLKHQRILPRNGKSTPALATPIPRVKTAPPPSVHHFNRNVASKNTLEPEIQHGRNKLFEIHGTSAANDVRKGLLRRGWLEKPTKRKSTTTVSRSRVSLSALYESTKAEVEMEFKDYFPGLIWSGQRINWELIREEQLVNQIPSPMFSFSSKVGLVSCLQNSHWFQESGKTNARCPRCYRLSIAEERVAFISDYLLTACISFIQYIVGVYEKDGAGGIIEGAGKVSSQQMSFALKHVKEYVRKRKHDDIDDESSHDPMQDDWEVFLEHYNRLVFGRGKLKASEKKDMIEDAKAKYEAAKDVLDMIRPFWPQLNIDGFHNLWICKPGEMSRGQGIIVVNNISTILELFPQKNKAWMNTVVQKYIERPLLIYNTKFDIRQWFLISRWNPLTVWFYKESYLRFCSKPYSINDLHERVHLCNHAVQSKYNIWKSRSVNLPEDNMWDSKMFQEYLQKEGKGEVWDTIIHPGMKEGILGVLLSSQDQFFSKNVTMRKNSFQLFGADFMICDDFTPWLIEINSNPDMSKDTRVLKRLCQACIEDMLRVVIDRRDNPRTDTGNFEIVYQEKENDIPLRLSGRSCVDLCLRGDQIRIPASKSKGSKSFRKLVHSKSIKSIESSKGTQSSSDHSNPKKAKITESLRSRSRNSVKLEFLGKHNKKESKPRKEHKSSSKSPIVNRTKSKSRVKVKSPKSKPSVHASTMTQAQVLKTKTKRLPEQYKSKSRGTKGNRPEGGQWKKSLEQEGQKEIPGGLPVEPTTGMDLIQPWSVIAPAPDENYTMNGGENNNVTLWKNPIAFRPKDDSPMQIDASEFVEK